MSLADRATIANMAPEYGATMGFFPVDAETLNYLRAPDARKRSQLVERYTKEQGLFRTDDAPPEVHETLKLDLSTVEPCLAGPKRPQDRVPLTQIKSSFAARCGPAEPTRFALGDEALRRHGRTVDNGVQRRSATAPW
jgi:aconitate hydratase